MWILNGKPISADSVLAIDGVVYPPNWIRLSPPEELTRLGITAVTPDPRPDDRYQFVNEDPANPGKWLTTPFPTERLHKMLKDHAANVRWGKENSGITINNTKVATDNTAQRKVSELSRRATAGTISLPFGFKTADGTWLDANLQTIQAIDAAVAAHVQACYALERSIGGQIEAGTVTTFEQINEAFEAAFPSTLGVQ